MTTRKRAVVLGGAGFIGGYVVQELLLNSYQVIIFDNLTTGRKESLPTEVIFIKGDIRNYDDVEQVLEEGDIVFHLAALTSVQESKEDPLPYYNTNVAGTYNVLEAARRKKALGIVFSSSAAIYGNQEGTMKETAQASPESPYGLQKRIGEQLCESYASLYGTPSICLRYFNVYGKGNKEDGSYAPVTARFLKAKREGKPLPIIGTGDQTRDFIHVQDVAKANIHAAELLRENFFDIINVCSGIPVTVLEIAEQIGGEMEYLPARKEIKHSLGDTTKYLTLIKQRHPTNFKDGLRDLLNQ